MNIHEHRELGEALRAWEQDVGGSTYFEEGFYHAARQTYDRWQECGECEGSGFMPIPDEPEFDVDTECPSCGGSGLKPNQARLDAMQELLDAVILNLLPPEHHLVIDAGELVRAFDKESDV